MRRAVQVAVIPSLASLCLAGLAVPAQAAAGSLTITALGRDGHATPARAWVTNLATNQQYTLTAGKQRKLPNGRYGVAITIAPHGITWQGDQTFGGATVSVHGRSANLRFDARRGKLFHVTPNLPSPMSYATEAELCDKGAFLGGMASAYGYEGMSTYFIPSTDKDLRLTFTAQWTQSAQGPYYWAARTTRGIPANPSYAYTDASFAKIIFKVQKGKAKQSRTSLMMAPTTPSFPCSPGGTSWGDFDAPRTVVAYASTGDWSASLYYGGTVTPAPDRRYQAGNTYHITLNRS